MKVQLVVTAAGPNQGRAIAITSTKFAIGRDADCQLRPASQAVSKRHCSIEIRAGRVFVVDIGSTNGTFVRGEAITGEVEVQPGDSLKVGPLEFQFEFSPSKRDVTPTPEGMKALSSESAAKLKAVMAPAIKPSSSVVNKPVPKAPEPSAEDDAMAAMLMALDDGSGGGNSDGSVPEGSTITELPAVKPDEAAKKDKKKTISGAEMSAAANDILRKYIRRTGG